MQAIEHIIQRPPQQTHQTPLLFQHGAWHGAWCWQQWLDYFTSLGYEVHAISLPGHGRSVPHKHINLFTLGDYVNIMAATVDSIKPTPVVIGHSMGGAIVQKYLEKRSLPAAVLLATIPAGGILPMMLRWLRHYPVSTLKGLLTLNGYHFVGTPALAQAFFFSEECGVDVPAVHTQLVRESLTLATQTMIPFARRPVGDTPVLVLAGEKDFLFSVPEQRKTAEKYNATFVEFPDQAHNLMLEPAWQQVANTIDDWLINQVKLP